MTCLNRPGRAAGARTAGRCGARRARPGTGPRHRLRLASPVSASRTPSRSLLGQRRALQPRDTWVARRLQRLAHLARIGSRRRRTAGRAVRCSPAAQQHRRRPLGAARAGDRPPPPPWCRRSDGPREGSASNVRPSASSPVAHARDDHGGRASRWYRSRPAVTPVSQRSRSAPPRRRSGTRGPGRARTAVRAGVGEGRNAPRSARRQLPEPSQSALRLPRSTRGTLPIGPHAPDLRLRAAPWLARQASNAAQRPTKAARGITPRAREGKMSASDELVLNSTWRLTRGWWCSGCGADGVGATTRVRPVQVRRLGANALTRSVQVASSTEPLRRKRNRAPLFVASPSTRTWKTRNRRTAEALRNPARIVPPQPMGFGVRRRRREGRPARCGA